MKLVIPGTLPSLNEIIDAAKGHWNNYRELKEVYTNLVAWKAKSLPDIEKFDVDITWYCPNKRKDKDNVMAGQKFVFDGLQAAGKIKNDGWKQIGKVSHSFAVDKHNPRVEIEIREIS
jgi:Holliday junction resolvase RusA-like endonuclease